MKNNEEETKGKTSKIDADRVLPAAPMDPASLNAFSDLLSGQHIDFNDPISTMGMQRTKFGKDFSAKNTLSINESENDFMTSQDLLDRTYASEEDEKDDYLLVSPADEEEEEKRFDTPPEASAIELLIFTKAGKESEEATR